MVEPRAENFDAAGNHPGAWWFIGQNLLVAADVLRRECPIDCTKIADYRVIQMSARVMGSMLMLRACAFECLLKALYLDRGGRLAEGGRYMAPKGKAHDLLALADVAGFALSDDERYFMDYLGLWITQGRYPIQKDWAKNLVAERHGRKREANWDERDEAAFNLMRERFRREGTRLAAKANAG
jgi:hypothetical protein